MDCLISLSLSSNPYWNVAEHIHLKLLCIFQTSNYDCRLFVRKTQKSLKGQQLFFLTTLVTHDKYCCQLFVNQSYCYQNLLLRATLQQGSLMSPQNLSPSFLWNLFFIGVNKQRSLITCLHVAKLIQETTVVPKLLSFTTFVIFINLKYFPRIT